MQKFYVFEDENGELDPMIVESDSEDGAWIVVSIECEDVDAMELVAIYDTEEEVDANGYELYDIY